MVELKYNFKSRLLIVLVVINLLSGCSWPNKEPKTVIETTTSSSTSVDEVLQGNDLIVVMNGNSLELVDPLRMLYTPFVELSASQIPPRLTLTTFQLSPDKQQVVWYAPAVGLLTYSFATKEISSLYQPTQWFNTNPFFVFHPQQNIVYLVDKEGLELISIALNDRSVSQTEIPYPFGTVFHLSPDASHMVFISGYKQDAAVPQYMFTTIDAKEPVRFKTGTELADRHLITWLPDSQGIVVIEDENTLRYYPLSDPNRSEVFYDFESVERILSVELYKNDLYVKTNADAWYVIDSQTRALKARIPVEIASELHRPSFYPWGNRQFLIEELVIEDENHYFHRLWLTDFLGIKSIVIPSYQETSIQLEVEGL